jgi:hypothetical protein
MFVNWPALLTALTVLIALSDAVRMLRGISSMLMARPSLRLNASIFTVGIAPATSGFSAIYRSIESLERGVIVDSAISRVCPSRSTHQQMAADV